MSRSLLSARSSMLLVVAAGLLAWSVQQISQVRYLDRLWPWIAILSLFLYGFSWSIARIYRGTPERQALPIVVLIGSMLGFLVALLLSVPVINPDF